MSEEVILEVTTIEENVTIETEADETVVIKVVAPAGPTGATGAAGPNSVTSATTSDGTGQIMLDTLAVGICNILDEVVFDTLTYTFAEGSAQALKDALGISFADVSDAETGTANLTLNNVSTVSFTAGNSSTTSGEITIFTNGPVFQWRSDTVEYGEKGFTFLTTDITSEVNYTLPNATGTLALTGNTNGEPDKLTAGTISGATTFNATSYTYGTGAAAAHRTALGLTTLATTTPGTNVANFLEFPTSANLALALTDEEGTGGGFVRAEGATLTSPALVGPVNLTSQDSSTADRVMNRSLSDTRVIKNRVEGKARVFTPLASPTSLGGSVNQTIGSNIVSLLISAANTHSGYLFSDLSPHSAWSGLGFNFARNFLCSGVFYLRNIGDQNSSLRFFIGTPASYRSDQASLSTAGLCLEIRRGGSALQARLAYFSNTYQETAWVNVHNSTIYYQSVYSFVIRNSGNGNVDVYFRVSTETVSTNTKPLPDIDGTPIISITNGPTTVGGTALAVALCAATSTTPSAQTEARVQNLDLELLS